MATSEENNLIGYDPLAWMEGDTDKGEDLLIMDENNGDNEPAGSEQGLTEEQLLIDNEINRIDDFLDDLIDETAQSPVLLVTEQDELVIVETDSALIVEMAEDCVYAEGRATQGAVADDCMDAGGRATQGAVAENPETEEIAGALIDLDATLTIQNVVKLHEKLKNSLALHDDIEINASDVSSIDTATLQLLVALKKDAVKLQKQVTIIYPSPRFVESAQLLGLLDTLDVHDV